MGDGADWIDDCRAGKANVTLPKLDTALFDPTTLDPTTLDHAALDPAALDPAAPDPAAPDPAAALRECEQFGATPEIVPGGATALLLTAASLWLWPSASTPIELNTPLRLSTAASETVNEAAGYAWNCSERGRVVRLVGTHQWSPTVWGVWRGCVVVVVRTHRWSQANSTDGNACGRQERSVKWATPQRPRLRQMAELPTLGLLAMHGLRVVPLEQGTPLRPMGERVCRYRG